MATDSTAAGFRSAGTDPWGAAVAVARDTDAGRRHRGGLRPGPLCGMAFALALSAACWGGLAALVGGLW